MRFCGAVENLVAKIGVVLFISMISAVFYEVIMRYVFNAPTFWSEALARAAMVWLVMLWARQRHPAHGQHPRRLSGRSHARDAEMVVRLAALCGCAGLCRCPGRVRFPDGAFNWSNINTGFEISMAWIYLAVPVSGVLIILFTIELIVTGERGYF